MSSGEGGQQLTWAPVSRRYHLSKVLSKYLGRTSTSVEMDESSAAGTILSSVNSILVGHHLASELLFRFCSLSGKYI